MEIRNIFLLLILICSSFFVVSSEFGLDKSKNSYGINENEDTNNIFYNITYQNINGSITGNPFDQDLNTTSNVTFDNLNVSGWVNVGTDLFVHRNFFAYVYSYFFNDVWFYDDIHLNSDKRIIFGNNSEAWIKFDSVSQSVIFYNLESANSSNRFFLQGKDYYWGGDTLLGNISTKFNSLTNDGEYVWDYNNDRFVYKDDILLESTEDICISGGNCLSTVSGGGGNPFDQDLNTTDNVEFNEILLRDNKKIIFGDGDDGRIYSDGLQTHIEADGFLYLATDDLTVGDGTSSLQDVNFNSLTNDGKFSWVGATDNFLFYDNITLNTGVDICITGGNCLSNVSGGGGGGNPFDQSLNTTDNVEFVNITNEKIISSVATHDLIIPFSTSNYRIFGGSPLKQFISFSTGFAGSFITYNPNNENIDIEFNGDTLDKVLSIDAGEDRAYFYDGAYYLAEADGTNGQVLTTYGNGTTYFGDVSGSGSAYTLIWAEENAVINCASDGGLIFSYGNGGTGNWGIRQWASGQIHGMSIQVDTDTATFNTGRFEIAVNGSGVGGEYWVTNPGSSDGGMQKTFATPYSFNAGDRLTFDCITTPTGGSTTDVILTMFISYN